MRHSLSDGNPRAATSSASSVRRSASGPPAGGGAKSAVGCVRQSM